MKRYSLLTLALLVSVAFFGCSGDDGSEGVSGVNGKDGSPQPINVLVLAMDNSGASVIAFDFAAASGLPPGSEVDLIDGVATPALSDLTPYDAIFVYTDNAPAAPDTLGDTLADYVDQGGVLVICQAALVTGFDIAGRIMTAGYSPLTPTASAGDGAAKSIDLGSITFPLHPVLVGVDLAAYTRPGISGYSIPDVAVDAEVIANFNGGLVAFAVNDANSVFALNDFPDAGGTHIHKVIGNAMIWLTSM